MKHYLKVSTKNKWEIHDIYHFCNCILHLSNTIMHSAEVIIK